MKRLTGWIVKGLKAIVWYPIAWIAIVICFISIVMKFIAKGTEALLNRFESKLYG